MLQAFWLKFYSAYSEILRFFFSVIPFSVGDIFYFLLAIYLLLEISLLLKCLFSAPKSTRLKLAGLKLMRLTGILAILYIQFYLSWGLNYSYRSILRENNIKVRPASSNEVDSLCRFLINRCAAEKRFLQTDKTEKHLTTAEILISTRQTYLTGNSNNALIKGLKLRKPVRISLKLSLYSRQLNYMGVSGYFNPFTGEAQVNQAIPEVELPFTSCHEVAHELGYSYEYEANYIGYLVSTTDKNIAFRYSGHFEALLYALPALRRRDSVAFKHIIKLIPAPVLADIRADFLFWQNYQGQTEKLISLFYTGYLKANNQPQGMQSYADLVPLLCAYYKTYGYPRTETALFLK